MSVQRKIPQWAFVGNILVPKTERARELMVRSIPIINARTGVLEEATQARIKGIDGHAIYCALLNEQDEVIGSLNLWFMFESIDWVPDDWEGTIMRTLPIWAYRGNILVPRTERAQEVLARYGPGAIRARVQSIGKDEIVLLILGGPCQVYGAVRLRFEAESRDWDALDWKISIDKRRPTAWARLLEDET